MDKIKTSQSFKSSSQLYRTIWRWHFYAGIIFAPILVMLAVTGAIYLYKPQIEAALYHDYYEVKPQDDSLSPSSQIQSVQAAYPDALITSYRPGENPQRSSEVHISRDEDGFTVFVNPYTGKIIGQLHDDDRIMDKIENIHGEIMVGTVGDRIVELAACWTIILIVTGMYLWFPRKKGIKGILIPRLHKGKQVLVRDLHAVPAFWVTAGMLFLVLTGLPWSGFWGTQFQNWVTNTGIGYPPSIWTGNAPTSTVQTKDIADVPWAAETLDVPESVLQGFTQLSINDVVNISKREGIDPGYTLYIPAEPTGVYTISAFPAKAEDEVTMHIDQYTGAVLADYRYANYEPLGKIIALGITLHKGTQFGWPNQLVSLITCLGIIFVAVSGFYLWLKRKPSHGLGAPSAPASIQHKGFFMLMIGLGILFPLVVLSFLVLWLFDWLVVRRIPALKKFLAA